MGKSFDNCNTVTSVTNAVNGFRKNNSQKTKNFLQKYSRTAIKNVYLCSVEHKDRFCAPAKEKYFPSARGKSP